MAIERVLVLGATGDQGHPLLRSLLAGGFRPTAGVRRLDGLQGTPFAGTPTVFADIEDQASLEAAMAGQDALALHLPFEFDRARAAGFGRTVAAAAKAAGLKKVVFNTSCFIADRDLDLSAHDGRRDIERSFAEIGIPYVFIEPVVFMDNIIRIWSKPSVVNSGVFAYPAAPTLKISWICLDDVAAYMSAALKAQTLVADHVPVGGPEALTGDEVAQRLTEAAGRLIRFESLTPDAYASKMSLLVTGSADVEPHGIYDRMAQFYRFYNAQPVSPLVVDVTAATRLLPITPTPFLAWAKAIDWTRID